MKDTELYGLRNYLTQGIRNESLLKIESYVGLEDIIHKLWGNLFTIQ